VNKKESLHIVHCNCHCVQIVYINQQLAYQRFDLVFYNLSKQKAKFNEICSCLIKKYTYFKVHMFHIDNRNFKKLRQ
jgi:hypothetical protein